MLLASNTPYRLRRLKRRIPSAVTAAVNLWYPTHVNHHFLTSRATRPSRRCANHAENTCSQFRPQSQRRDRLHNVAQKLLFTGCVNLCIDATQWRPRAKPMAGVADTPLHRHNSAKNCVLAELAASVEADKSYYRWNKQQTIDSISNDTNSENSRLCIELVISLVLAKAPYLVNGFRVENMKNRHSYTI